jgi:hypothetical protein
MHAAMAKAFATLPFERINLSLIMAALRNLQPSLPAL